MAVLGISADNWLHTLIKSIFEKIDLPYIVAVTS